MSTVNTPEANPLSAPDTRQAGESPGALLRMAREQAQLSQREVADKLHLLRCQVSALEEDRFDYFNAEIFCKGYLRSYGKLMGVDPQRLIDAYTKQQPTPPVNPKPVVTNKVLPIQSPSKGHNIQYWCIAVVVVVVAALWLVSGDDHKSPSPSLLVDERLLAVDESDRSLFESLGSPKPPLAEAYEPALLASNTITGLVPVTPVKPAKPPVEQPYSQSHSQTQTSAVSSPAMSDTAQQTVEPSKLDVLSFRFSGDCWVKVTDSDDKVLVADLKRAEDVLNLRGRAPFKVTLGYAPAVSLQYNGESITIHSKRLNNTANIVVGQS